MYLHLGQDKCVNIDEIIGIFDIETTTISKISREYLAKSEKKGIVVNVCTDLPKSFVVCEKKDKKNLLFISQISSSTLLKRATGMKYITEGK